MQARAWTAVLFLPLATTWGQSDPSIPVRIRKPAGIAAAVTGMPYSGEWVSERTEIREDQRIAETGASRKDYRDSAGRTRRERMLPRDSEEGVRVVIIDDPAAGIECVLEPEKKLAHRFMLDTAQGAAGAPALPAKTEPLGVEMIRGLRAQGVRRTTVLPMGDLVVDTWTAADLQIMLREHTIDPAFGETTVHLTELRTDEPPAALFQVPAEYRIVDEANDFTIAMPLRPHSKPPEVISRVGAKYTEEARRAGIQGTVVLAVAIDRTGRPRGVQVERGLEPGLDEEAVKAVRQWKFRPAEQDGRPVRVNVHVEVTFSLLN